MKNKVIIHCLTKSLPKTAFNVVFIPLLLIGFPGTAQEIKSDSSVLKVIKDVKQYQQVALSDPTRKMVDLKKYIPAIVLNLRYATTKNFTHHKLYPSLKTTYMRLPAAEALRLIQQELNARNLGIMIFDAYRPYRATVEMWELVKDERYVADPKKGSGHNRGTTVDLTIVDLKTKQPLEMGTGFDNFTDSAHHSFIALPVSTLANRKMLKDIMEKHGFVALETEWWHYGLANSGDFDLMDIGFEELSKALKR